MADEAYNQALGRRLRKARVSAGYKTAKDAAEMLRAHVQNVRDHEAGRRGVSPQQLDQYAKAYRVDYEWLATGRGDARSESAEIIEFRHIFVDSLDEGDREELLELARMKARRKAAEKEKTPFKHEKKS